MATRRKVSDPWRAGDAMTLSNGMEVVKWENQVTGESRLVPAELHPDDQPNAAALPVAINDEAQAEDDQTPADRVSVLLREVNGDNRAYVSVYRMESGTRVYCKKYRPEEFEDGNFDMIRDAFGAGEYELRLYATKPETGKFAVRNLTRINLAPVRLDTPHAGALPSGLSQVLATIAQGQEQMLRALVDMKQAPQKDPMDEMTKMLSMMTMMREAMGLNVPQAQSRSSIGEIVEAIKELRGAAAEVLPEKDEPADLMGMLPKVLDLVSQGQQAQQQAPMMPTYQDNPGAVLSPVTLPPAFATQMARPDSNAHDADHDSTKDSDMNPLALLKLRGYLKTLVSHAEKKSPVADAAAFVYEKLPDELIDMMELPNWLDLLTAVAPEVKPHREYLNEVRDAALKMFNDDAEAEGAVGR